MKIKRFNENIDKNETLDKEISDKIYEQNVDPNQRIMMFLSDLLEESMKHTMLLEQIRINTQKIK